MTTAEGYDNEVTRLCERALVTVIGNAGFWGRRLYLVGGLVPMYLYGGQRDQTSPHVGSRDIDLAVVLIVDDPSAASYETLHRNIRDSGFAQAPHADDPEFRWRRDIDGVSVILEFICETDQVEPGHNFKPRSGAGSNFQAFNVEGASLVALDHKVVRISAERLDDGGDAVADVRVAGLLPFITLKISAYVDRHSEKDAYDIVWTLGNHPDGPKGAGRDMSASPALSAPFVTHALTTLGERFANPRNDAPTSYAAFLAVGDDPEAAARLRNEAVETVRTALEGIDAGREPMG